MAESEEELQSLLMRVKEESDKADLKNIKKTKIMASSPITSWQIEGEKVEAVTDVIFLGSRVTMDDDCSCELKRHLLLGRRPVTTLVVEVYSLSRVHSCDPMDCSPPGFCPWDFLGKSTGVGCHCLLQGIFPTQESNPGSLQADSLLTEL